MAKEKDAAQRAYQKRTGYAAQKKYNLENLQRIGIDVFKGWKEPLQALAKAKGISLNRYIVEAVEKESGLPITQNPKYMGDEFEHIINDLHKEN